MSTTSDRDSLLEKGRVHLRAGRFTEATAAFREAVRLDPASDVAWELLGGALSLQRDWSGGVHAFRKALECNPHDVRHYYELAQALHEGLGRSFDARLYLERGLEYDPQHPASRKLLAQLAALTDVEPDSRSTVVRQGPAPEILTTQRILWGVAAGVGAALGATALSLLLIWKLGFWGILTAVGTGWCVGMATARGCGQGGRVPAQLATGVAVLFLLPTCLFLTMDRGVSALSLFLYGLSLCFGVQRAYATALTARSF